MKIALVMILFIVYVQAVENIEEPKVLGIPYPMEKELQTIQAVKDILVNPKDRFRDMKDAYSKPLKKDFEYLLILDENEAKENLTF